MEEGERKKDTPVAKATLEQHEQNGDQLGQLHGTELQQNGLHSQQQLQQEQQPPPPPQQQQQQEQVQQQQQQQNSEVVAAASPDSGTSSSSPTKKSSLPKRSATVGGGGGLASVARQLAGRASREANNASPAVTDNTNNNGERGASNGNGSVPHDDLPLGSEANSLPSDATVEGARHLRHNGRPDPRLMQGWQSFNSDASNHTTASSASLEMLLNTRQVDPEIMLRNLGFGGDQPSILPSLERVPERFLYQPSQAYGIGVPYDEPGDGEAGQEATGNGGGQASAGSKADGSSSSGGNGAATGGSATPRRKPKTGIWTVARTLSMFGNLNRQVHHGPNHNNTGGASSPVHGVPQGSVLNVPNQIYLANQGFYKQHKKDSAQKGKQESKANQKPDKIQEEEEGGAAEGDTSSRASGSAAAANKRRMFQKTRSRQTWSLCEDSGDEAGGGRRGGASGDRKKHSTTSNNSDWMTQSLDESLSREDSTGIDDSLSKFAYFSTTTESSTDSIDRNSDTEKVFEEIRQQYEEGQMGLLPKKERSSSEDLFLPRRRRGSGDEGDVPVRNGRSVRFGELSDDEDEVDNGVSGSDGGRGSSSSRRRRNGETRREGVGVGEAGGDDDDALAGFDRSVLRNEELDLLRASLDNYGNGGENGGGRYFISPANSRQATVEKAPSVVDHSYQPHDDDNNNDDQSKNGKKNRHDSNNNNNNHNDNSNNNNGGGIVDECFSSASTTSLQSSARMNSVHVTNGRAPSSGNSDVRIVVSNSTEVVSDTGVVVAPPTGDESSRLGVARGLQRASSDSGSSSSGGTAVGSSSGVTVTADDLDTLRLSESENSITDKDSISRTNSPSGFLQPWGQGQNSSGGGQGGGSPGGSRREVEMVSCGVQTSSEDLADAALRSTTGGGGDGRDCEGGKQLQQTAAMRNSNGFQLSSLPPAINPVQLMRRLHSSSDDLLPRMSSLQSDSSGFGDGEPGLDSGPVDGGGDNLVKVANLGSSSESNGTIASSVTTAILTSHPGKGETATQTSVDESQYDLSPSHQPDSRGHDDIATDQSKPARYISHCIILHQATKNAKDFPPTSKDCQKDNNDNLIEPTNRYAQSDPGDPSLHDYYYYQHQFCDGDEENQDGNHRYHSTNSPGLSANDRMRMPPLSTNQNTPELSRLQAFYNQDPAPRGYAPAVPFQDHRFHHPHHHQLHHHRHHLHNYSGDQEHLYNLDDSDPHDPHHTHTRRHGNHHHHNRRHHHHKHHSSKSSDDFIDDYNDIEEDDIRNVDSIRRSHRGRISNRNQTPLSEELAEASSYSLDNSSVPSNGRLSSLSTSTPIHPVDNDNSRVVSSVSVFVNADGTHRASPTTHTPRSRNGRTTPVFSYPPLAGNVTGVRTEDGVNSNHANTKPPVFLSRKNLRQKSCDILDDDDPEAQDNRFFRTAGAGKEDNEAFLPGMADEVQGASAARSRLQYQEYSPLPSSRHGYFDNTDSADYNVSYTRGSIDVRQSPVTPMTFLPRGRRDPQQPQRSGSLQSLPNLQTGAVRRVYPSATPPLSQTWDDLEGGYSSMAETSSEFSVRSMPAAATGRSNNGVLDSQKLARLVNRPSSLRNRRGRLHSYHPRRNFREWSVLSRRKRLIEEDRLLQHTIHKYKTEISLMQAAFLNEYGKAFHEMTPEEREEVKEMEALWAEVNFQIAEMEDLVNSRVESVHAGNNFHSLLSSVGVIDRAIDLLKEQIYQQQLSSGRGGEEGESLEDLEDFEEFEDDVSSRDSILSAHSMMEGWRRPTSRNSWRMGNHRGRLQSSASTSNLPSDINLSLDEMKSSLMKEMKDEIRTSTRKLEDSLTKKELEIQELRKKLALSSKPPPLPSSPPAGKGRLDSSSSSTTTTSSKRASTKVQRRSQAWIARSRSRVTSFC